MLEVFKNTLSTRLYWVLLPIEDLRQVVETAKGILRKEKIDRQLAGQTSLTLFMNVKDGYISRKFTFDTQDSLDEKNRLMSMMSKLTAYDEEHTKQFKPKTYQSKRRGQTGNFYDCSYGRRIIKIDIGQIVEIRGYCLVVEYNMDRITGTDQGIIRTIEVILEEGISEEICNQIKIIEVKIIWIQKKL